VGHQNPGQGHSLPCRHNPVSLFGDYPVANSRLSLIQDGGGSHPYTQKEAQPMMKANLGLANKGIERILELSADAHVRRRGTVKDSPEFHNLTGAIAAYGKALALLTALQEREELYEMIELLDVPGCGQPVC
jgi:hypothetical protein